MTQHAPGPPSSRRKTGVMALLLAAVLNILLPIALMPSALAATDGDGAKIALLSGNPMICTAEGVRPLEPLERPASPLGLNGHCVFCFAGTAPAVLPVIDVAPIAALALHKTAFGISPNETVLSTPLLTPGNPRAPPLSL